MRDREAYIGREGRTEMGGKRRGEEGGGEGERGTDRQRASARIKERERGRVLLT